MESLQGVNEGLPQEVDGRDAGAAPLSIRTLPTDMLDGLGHFSVPGTECHIADHRAEALFCGEAPQHVGDGGLRCFKEHSPDVGAQRQTDDGYFEIGVWPAVLNSRVKRERPNSPDTPLMR